MSPISSLGWLGRTVALLSLMGRTARAADLSYSLVDDYTPANWFDMFSFDSVSQHLRKRDEEDTDLDQGGDTGTQGTV